HALTVNRQILRQPAGQLVGGPTSVLIIAGASDTVHVPPVDVVQLSLNKPGGVLRPDSVITVHAMVNLNAGTFDNYDALHTVSLDSGVQVSRTAGTLANNPVYHGPINLLYNNPPVGVTVTGPELPANPAILQNLAIIGTQQDTVLLSADATINGHLDLSNMGCFKVGNHTLTLRDSLIAPSSKGPNLPAMAMVAGRAPRDGAKAPKRLLTDSTSSLVLNGPVVRLPGDIDTLGNLTLTYTTGTAVDTIDLFGQLILRSAALTAGTLRYAPGASLRYEGATPQTTSDIEFPAAKGPAALVLANPTGVTLHADRSLAGGLQFVNGILTTGANTVTIDSGATVTGAAATRYVAGRMARYVHSGAARDTFAIGTAKGYTPAALAFGNVTTTGLLTANSPDTSQPDVLNPANCLNRYWRFTNGAVGFDSATLSLTYLHGDFHGGISESGDENTMAAGQYSGIWTFPAVASRDTANNTITLRNVTGLADFALAKSQDDIYAAPDTTRPVITASLPADGATNVLGSDSVKIVFSEPVRKSLVSYTFLPLPGTVDTVWSADSTTLVFNHGAFGSLTKYTVRVSAVQDTAGNPLTGRDSIGFTSADTSLPAVTSIYPANGANNVSVYDSLVVGFSKRMDTASVALASAPLIPFTTRAWNGALSMLTLSHGPLITDTAYTFTVTTALDSAGHAMAGPYTITFRTPDTTAPYAPSMVSPADGFWQSASAVVFHWNAVTKIKGGKATAVRYIIQTDTVATFSSGAVLSDTTDLTYDTLTLAQGRHYWRVRAYDLAGNQGAFSGYNMVGVDQTPPTAAIPMSPANAGILNASPVTFAWQPATDPYSGVASYHLQCALDSLFTAGVHDTVVTGSTAALALADSLYYWHVAATDNAGNAGSFSTAYRFNLDTQAPAIPAMVAPADSAWQAANGVTFQWGGVAKDGAKSTTVQYVLQTDTAATFASGALTTDTVAVTQLAKTLAQGRRYWHVRAYDQAGNQSAFSAARWVGVDQTPPPAVALRTPANGADLNTGAITFTWQPVTDSYSGVAAYRLQCANDSLFATGLRDTAVTDTTVSLALSDSGYYWHVRAEDRVANAGAYSPVRRLVKDTRAPLVAATDPGNLATDVAVNKVMTITFSEPVQPATVGVTPAPIIPGLIVSWDSTHTRLSITHDPLAAGTGYSVKVDSARDLAGNQLDTLTLPARFGFTARTAALATA
ncbi:MAG TPA: Ig-like domain-containing protein, partial [Candidatus Edwardsbacteria bacterium]|nr:Ig-like domain-containing protein [Candidatus Edwardsbacteria bacterium]